MSLEKYCEIVLKMNCRACSEEKTFLYPSFPKLIFVLITKWTNSKPRNSSTRVTLSRFEFTEGRSSKGTAIDSKSFDFF